MRRLSSVAVLLCALLLLAGCLRPGQSSTSSAKVTGNVTYTDGAPLPNNATVTVQLRDANAGSAHGAFLSQQQINTNGNQAPIAFEVSYTPSDINQSHKYVLYAFIMDGANKLLYASQQPAPVITNGNPVKDVDVPVESAQGQAAGGAVTDSPTWSAILFNNGKSAIVSVTGVEITAQFSADGQLSGFSGCNTYTGTYTANADGTVKMGPIAATQKTCSEPANVMQQESQYLAALQSVTTFQVQGQNLSTQSATGQMAVQFARTAP